LRNKKVKRKTGRGAHKCVRCGNMNGVIRFHGLYYCRRCFREVAHELGFRKYN